MLIIACYFDLFYPKLTPLAKPLPIKAYAIKDSFAFADIIMEQDSKFFMWSLEVNSLFFTNIPLEMTIKICTTTLFENV